MSVDVSKLPKLGFGLMRLPERDGKIAMSRVCDMVDAYMKNGMNYFDTAYVYHGGMSEVAAREAIVKRYPRDSFYLATKLPAWEVHSLEDRDKVFDIQCERAGVDYFDFYLLHSVEDGGNYDKYVQYDCFLGITLCGFFRGCCYDFKRYVYRGTDAGEHCYLSEFRAAFRKGAGSNCHGGGEDAQYAAHSVYLLPVLRGRLSVRHFDSGCVPRTEYKAQVSGE